LAVAKFIMMHYQK